MGYVVRVSSDGRHAVSVGYDRTLRLWDIGQSTQRAVFPLLGRGECVAFSPCGDELCCSDDNGNLVILELKGGDRKVSMTVEN